MTRSRVLAAVASLAACLLSSGPSAQVSMRGGTLAPALTVLLHQPQLAVVPDSLPVCLAVADTQKLREALAAAPLGDEAALQTVAQTYRALDRFADSPNSPTEGPTIRLLNSLIENTGTLLGHKAIVQKVGQATESINLHGSPELLAAVKAAAAAEQAEKPPPPRVAALETLEMLSQRLGKSAAGIVTRKGLDAEAIFLLRKDAEVFQRVATGLLNGDTELRLRPAQAPAAKERVTALLAKFGAVKAQADFVQSHVIDLVRAREAQSFALADATALSTQLRTACLSAGGTAPRR